MEDYISRREHDEFARRVQSEHERISDEDKRQNKRINEIKEQMKEFNALVGTVARLASNMESMLHELRKQGERLEFLENKDGEMWRYVVSHIVTVAIGSVGTFVFMRLGMK